MVPNNDSPKPDDEESLNLVLSEAKLKLIAPDPDYRPLSYHLPGILGAAVSGLIAYCVLFLTSDMGSALFVAVPVSFGTLLGYHVRMGKLALAALVLVVVLSIVSAIVMMDFSGIFCGLTLGIIFLGPALFGMLIGSALGWVLKQSNFSQAKYLPSLLIIALPYVAGLIEREAFPMPETIAVVETNLDLHSSAEDLWNSLMFYEEVRHEPPWILKLALPKPICAEGQMGQVGQVRRCVYDRGHLTKIITRRDEGRFLGFRVIEQNLHFEHDVRLKDGSFAITPIVQADITHSDRTRMTLTTGYQRLLRPAWVWEPIERHVVHTLHEHVLEGIRRDSVDRSLRVDPTPESGRQQQLLARRTPVVSIAD